MPAPASQETLGSGLQHAQDQVRTPLRERLGARWVPIPEGPHPRLCLASPRRPTHLWALAIPAMAVPKG